VNVFYRILYVRNYQKIITLFGYDPDSGIMNHLGFNIQDVSRHKALTPGPSPKKKERGEVVDLRVLHRESSAKPSNRQSFPSPIFGRGLGVRAGKRDSIEK
jgi:hypothetical protein